MNRQIFKTKTFWASALTAIATVVTTVVGQEYATIIQTVGTAIIAVCIRDGMVKEK